MPEHFCFSGTLLVRLRESTVTMTTWVSSVKLSMEQIPAVSGQAAMVSSCHRYVKAYLFAFIVSKIHPNLNSLNHRRQPNPRSDPPLPPPQHPLPQLPPQQGHPCQGGKTTDELFLGVDPGPRPAGPSLMRKLPLIWRPPKGSRTLGPRHRLKGGTPTTTQGKTDL